MLPAASHLGLLDRVVRSANMLFEGGFCCLGHRRKLIYHRVECPMSEYLNIIVAACNTTAG